jgi:hypothetical protein
MAGKIYVNQALQVTLDCKASLEGATALAIAVALPDGSTLTWSPATPSGTTITYAVPENVFGQAGDWRLQALVTLGGVTTPGETAVLRVYERFR